MFEFALGIGKYDVQDETAAYRRQKRGLFEVEQINKGRHMHEDIWIIVPMDFSIIEIL
jgi:hypothetical protein